MPFEGHKILKMFFLFKLYIIVIINNAINSLTKCKVKTFLKNSIMKKKDIPKLFFLCYLSFKKTKKQS